DAAIPMIHPHPCIPTLGRESQRIGAIPGPMENGGIREFFASFLQKRSTCFHSPELERWSLTTIREKLIKISGKIVAHARYTTFQMAEVAVPRMLFNRVLQMIDHLRRQRAAVC
ncbi:MAG: hypothetical protein HIU90_03875, partial [Proteobacteria bacterium]|nr:hypothetical protein [Pseudomonadota bacterium]